ncbi:lisH domain-containing protein FOPNL-like [Notechis scutatus]|uniref:Centrosomal protein 20 n=1 Tax=Notechis scutatus TaxID=8663 RepID=A0A6J1VGT1_9SAUR|nr:lisH domain-containing protein FOPNL-like [Notechis scutatus]XP_026539114.1 lisH domain-containing protein FOPNL-like [Notechis scutatus]XP_026539115.1 lisH domain-containing protein FOPNL-like [Notechis scutatus]
MATVAELKAALKEALARSGALGQVRARVRAEVFATLDDPGEPRPAASRETLLLNELIREYLQFHRYNSSASVFLAESGQPEIPLDRDFLAKELHVVEDPSSRSVPLLYGILTQLLRGNEEKGPPTSPGGPSVAPSKWTTSKPSH